MIAYVLPNSDDPETCPGTNGSIFESGSNVGGLFGP